MPVALIVAGSGPTDRDGNGPGRQGGNDSLKLLSRALADAGVASVRYDKRVVGASAAAGPREDDLRFEHYGDDASGRVSQLARDTRFTKTALVGHSEGALVGLLAARRASTAAYVSIAGPGEPAAVLLRRQLAGRLPADLSAAAEKVLATLESGAVTSEVPPPLAALFRPSVQPYPISWFKGSPRHEIAALKAPCLLLQGTTDLQARAPMSARSEGWRWPRRASSGPPAAVTTTARQSRLRRTSHPVVGPDAGSHVHGGTLIRRTPLASYAPTKSQPVRLCRWF